MSRLSPVLLALAPWRIAARQAPPSRRRFVLVAWLLGLLTVPALGLGTLLSDALVDSPAEELTAPQAGLMTAIAEGIFETRPAPSWALALLGLGWLVGGLAAGLLGGLLHAGVLLGLSRGAPQGKRQYLALGAWGFGYSLTGVVGLSCVGSRSPRELAAALALALAASLPGGALGYGVFRRAGAGRARAGLNATLYGLVLWVLTMLALEVATLLTFGPVRLVERIVGA